MRDWYHRCLQMEMGMKKSQSSYEPGRTRGSVNVIIGLLLFSTVLSQSVSVKLLIYLSYVNC